jgi:HlyD family secretion protein/epimerase transport system membrane fusion protein
MEDREAKTRELESGMSGQEIILRDSVTVLEPYNPDRIDTRTLQRTVRTPIWFGLALIAVFVVGLGAWALIVPLAGGSVSQGVISPDGSTRTVQHLEGGIIRRLHVRDGDIVSRGQPLLVLESVQPQAEFDLLHKQQSKLQIMQIRLQAEIDEKEVLVFPPEYAGENPETAAAMFDQRRLFQARNAVHQARKRILGQRVSQLKEQINGYQAQITSTDRQLELIAEELEGKKELRKKGHLSKPELLRLLRMEAEINGRRGQFRASIAQAEQQIGEAEMQLIAHEAERRDQLTSQLDHVRTELSSLTEKLLASEDVLNRTVVTAPVNGTVVNLQFKTERGVIPPGAPILDIVPADETLVIDARVSPADIDVVHAGLGAKVQLSSFSSRSFPRISGIVRSVSADRLVDEVTNEPYYRASIEVNAEELEQIGSKIELVPGMPADVLIVTEERTMAQYLFQPFLDAIWKTFREV